MSILELGAVGEFLGSIGVVATLIYLSIQIRQSIRTSESVTLQAVNDSINASVASWGERSFVEAMSKAEQESWGSLNENEQWLFRFRVNPWLRAHQNAWEQWRRGALPEGAWESFELALFSGLMNGPPKHLWQDDTIKGRFLPEFLEYVDSNTSGTT
jgi:hypothetical protein